MMIDKIRKLLSIITFLLLIVLLNGCTSNGEYISDEYVSTEPITNNNLNQYKYSYEIVNAKITNIDCRHWFAICHHYNWDIEVYCEKYKISYSENGDDSGAFADIPYYFDKSEGDMVKLKVRKEYIKDKLYKIKAIEIVD